MECYTQKIALTNARFFAYHGYYPEEQLIGNEFFLDITCTIHHLAGEDDDLANTINYELLYQLAKEEMAVPRKLLESVIKSIVDSIRKRTDKIDEITVNLRKNNPPFGGDRVMAEVSLCWQRNSSF
ncbi:dihydroneopterin aldolase [Olivibacter ginsenosidimutans]|uniref:7,8-dihydroneopterin aldolase n=1 Tax=Olivibacter ginsenosidimutans TaxID=1176537 RepID=A0ABP9ATD7_9SPHI